jgi:hypothetical protein
MGECGGKRMTRQEAVAIIRVQKASSSELSTAECLIDNLEALGLIKFEEEAGEIIDIFDINANSHKHALKTIQAALMRHGYALYRSKVL